MLAVSALLGWRAIPAAAREKKTEPGAKTEPLTSAQPAERTAHRHAVEAIIWGMPAVTYDLMLQEMLSKTNAKVNEIVYRTATRPMSGAWSTRTA